LMAQSVHEDNLREPLATYYRFASTQVEEHLRSNALALGLQPKLDPAFIPRILNGLLDGLLMQRIVDPDSIRDEQVIESLEILAASLFDVSAAPALKTDKTDKTEPGA
jgi:hypothetical protein